MKNRGKIVIIEGVSNTGKTTLCKKIAFLDNWKMIPECAEFVLNFPKPSKTFDEEVANQFFFFNLEVERLKNANHLSENGINVVLDRQLYLH